MSDLTDKANWGRSLGTPLFYYPNSDSVFLNKKEISMRKSITSGQGPAVDAFLECVARCLAKRWLKIQRGIHQVEGCSDPQKELTAGEQPLKSTSEDGATPETA